MIVTKCLLMFIKIIMHLPKLILRCYSFSCFSCMLSMGMNLSNWKIAKYKSQLVTKMLLNLS